MTVSTTTRKAGPFTGNGVQTVFPFVFKVFSTADVLVVEAVIATGVETTKVLTTHYTVALNADQDASPGGSVTMLVAPPTGDSLTIGSQVAQTQGVAVTNSGGWYPEILNAALDRAIILIQQLSEKLGRAITVPISSSVSTTIPTPAANQYLGWDGLGTSLINIAGQATSAVSGVMAAIVNAASLAAARTGLQLGSGDSPTFTGVTVGSLNAQSLNAQSLNGGPFAGFRNVIVNGGFTVNQRVYASGGVLAAGSFGHDRWKAGAGGGDYSFAQLKSDTTITIAANKTLIQVVEDADVQGTAYVLSWTGTAQARYAISGAVPAGAYANSPILITGQTAGLTMSVEFGNGASAGTLGKVQLERGTLASHATSFEQRPFALELRLAMRQFQKSFSYATLPANGAGAGAFATNVGLSSGYGSNTFISFFVPFQVQMSSVPTVTPYGNNTSQWVVDGAFNANAYVGPTISDHGFGMLQQVAGAGFVCGHWTASTGL